MSGDRVSLEDALLRRAGQLAAYLGRYDMYALAIENMLYGDTARDASQRGPSIATRGASIQRLLKSTGHSELHQQQYSKLDAELRLVLSRNEIRASNPAVIAPLPRGSSPTPIRRDWFDHEGVSDDDIVVFIVQMERDIAQVATLFLRAAQFAADISGGPPVPRH